MKYIKLHYKTLTKKKKRFLLWYIAQKELILEAYVKTLHTNFKQSGYMKELKRTKVGKFLLEDAITLEEIENHEEIENKKKILQSHIITMESFLKEKEAIILSQKQIPLFLNGVLLSMNKTNGIYRIYNEENQFIGSGIIKEQKLKRDIILQPDIMN